MPEFFENLPEVEDKPGLSDKYYEYFKQEFEQLSGISLNLYKEKQMRRRINTLIARKKLSGYEEFISLIKGNPDEFEAFKDYITINVTEFFRTPDHWSYLEDEVIPDLLNHSEDKLKIWSCACSTGEEAYSLAISLAKAADTSRFHIIASDIDDKVLKTAADGIYDEKSVSKLPSGVIDRYFEKNGSKVIVSDELKSCVEFRKLDVLKDEYPSDCDLIVCRNILIYFTEEAKEDIYCRLQKSLKSGGYLFTGNTEQIIYYKKYGLKKLKNFIYQN